MSQHQEIWCQPADQPKRQFLVMFDELQMDVAVFDDEAEARAYWEKANLNWTCYLMGTIPRSPSPLPREAPRSALVDVPAVESEPVAGYRRRLPQYAFEHYEFEQPGYQNPSITDWEPLYTRTTPVPALVGEDGWLPIETAPKDGSTFLAVMAEAYSPKATICKCIYNAYFSPSQGEKFVVPGWNEWWPTHWRPLPAPPLTRKASTEEVGGSTSIASDTAKGA